jgi:hypothetical protein
MMIFRPVKSELDRGDPAAILMTLSDRTAV